MLSNSTSAATGAESDQHDQEPSQHDMPGRNQFWNAATRKKFILAILPAFLLLLLLFLGLQSYIFGSTFQNQSRTHNIDVLAVDFDGGVVGQALQGAWQELEAPTFLGLKWRSQEEYPSPADVYKAVCKGDFWGGIYVLNGSSQRLTAALQGGQTGESYQPNETIQYVWNEARYPTAAEGYLRSNLETLIATARVVYHRQSGNGALSHIPSNDTAAAQVLLNPIVSSSINIKHVSAGARVFWNTAAQVLVILPQFFLMMALNGIAGGFQLYSKLSLGKNAVIRACLSFLYTFLGSMCAAAIIYAFREDTSITGGQYALLWMALWLYMHIQFLIFDVATTFIPQAFIAFFVISWVIINISGTIFPFELTPGFFHWEYALPTYNMYQLEIQIISGGGCYNRLWLSLPIMFVWWAVMFVGASLALWYRCRKAVKLAKESDVPVEVPQKGATSDFSISRQATLDSLPNLERVAARAEHARYAAERMVYGPSLPLPLVRSFSQEEMGKQ